MSRVRRSDREPWQAAGAHSGKRNRRLAWRHPTAAYRTESVFEYFTIQIRLFCGTNPRKGALDSVGRDIETDVIAQREQARGRFGLRPASGLPQIAAA